MNAKKNLAKALLQGSKSYHRVDHSGKIIYGIKNFGDEGALELAEKITEWIEKGCPIHTVFVSNTSNQTRKAEQKRYLLKP